MPQVIGVPKETAPGEKRVATVPEVVEKLIKLGFYVSVESGAGEAANFDDDSYRAAGVRAVAKTIDYLRNPGGRLPSPTKTELTQIADTVAAIANDPDGKATIEAVHHKKTA